MEAANSSTDADIIEMAITCNPQVNSDTQFNELNKTKQKLSPFSKTVYLVSNLLRDFFIHFVMSISPFTPAIFAAILGLIHQQFHVTITSSEKIGDIHSLIIFVNVSTLNLIIKLTFNLNSVINKL